MILILRVNFALSSVVEVARKFVSVFMVAFAFESFCLIRSVTIEYSYHRFVISDIAMMARVKGRIGES